MGLYSIKDYLNYYDVAEYLDDMGYFAINFHNRDDVWRYNDLLLKLHKQERLTPVFELNYPRPVNVFYYDKPLDEIDDISDETECKIINQYQKEVDGYCCLGYVNFDELLENYLPFFNTEKPKKIIYFYEPCNETLEKNCLIEFLEYQSPVVSHLDILFPKSEIIKIFGDTPYNQTIPKLNKAIDIINKQTKEIETLQAEIDRLQALAGATATPANNALSVENSSYTTLDNALSARTEQSYLTTIGLLLELCQRKVFTSQSQIIDAIAVQSIYGQKQRALEERFAKANLAIDQARKSK